MKRKQKRKDTANQPSMGISANHGTQADERSTPISQEAAQATDGTHGLPELFTRIHSFEEAAGLSLAETVTERMLFTFARALKALELTHGRKLALPDREAAFEVWWSRAGSRVHAASREQYNLDFLDVFRRVHTPLGANPLEAAIEWADRHPLPPELRGFTDPCLVRLFVVMEELQRHHGAGSFYLGCRDAGRILRSNKDHAHKMLNGLVAKEKLDLVAKGHPGKDEDASRYRLPPLPTLS